MLLCENHVNSCELEVRCRLALIELKSELMNEDEDAAQEICRREILQCNTVDLKLRRRNQWLMAKITGQSNKKRDKAFCG